MGSSVSISREKFVEAVEEVTDRDDLIAQAKKMDKFPIASWWIVNPDCGCVVGELLKDEAGVYHAPEMGTYLYQAGNAIDEAVTEIARVAAYEAGINPDDLRYIEIE